MPADVRIADWAHGQTVCSHVPGRVIVPDRFELPREIDVTIPSPARIYDYFLGGKDNFQADRDAAQKALSLPDGRKLAWANRKFLVRAVRYMAKNGIDQFIDIGTGIPTSPNVHEAARSIAPKARVVYVDNDAAVLAHARALLANHNDGIEAIYGDIRYPSSLIEDRTLRNVIDFRRPVCVLFVAVLHFLTNGDDPYNSVAVFRDNIPSGSHIAISHIASDGASPAVMSTIQEAYAHAKAPAIFRTRAEIKTLFTGLEMVKPGLVQVSDWRASGRKPANAPALGFIGGAGRKP